jgi:hypothetical protein
MPDSNKANPPNHGTKDISLPPSGEAMLPYQEQPPKGKPDKRIHPRRPLPLVPDAPPKSTEDKPDPSDPPSDRSSS